MKEQVDKIENFVENNTVEFGIILSLLNQLLENHEYTVGMARSAENKEVSDYTVVYETLRMAQRTTDLLSLVHRLVSGVDAENEKMTPITRELKEVITWHKEECSVGR